jgi:hypothetical protein
MTTPHDVPTARQLVESVREWIEKEVAPAVTGRLQFHSRVAVNVLAMVEREMESGAEDAAGHAVRLAELGVSTDAELAALIRNGDFDGDLARVLDVLTPSIRSKVAVANPKYLAD